jgi:uncharacterized repeat protein (TIGR03803 family)
MRNLGPVRIFCAIAAFGVATAIISSAQTFHSENVDGLPSWGPLVQGIDGNLYGSIWWGGTTVYCTSCGTAYTISPDGKLADFYNFCSQPGCADGASPHAGLTQGKNGDFYGVTTAGGAFSNGTVFELTPRGELTTLYSFCSLPNCTDGDFATGGLVFAANGNFYGTTEGGGISTYCIGGCGTVFEITPEGKLTTLHTFCSAISCPDGAGPNAALVQAADGNLYGTTNFGGSGAGVIFKVTLQGKITTFYSFNGEAEGANPNNLIEAADGSLYGTTGSGGVTGGGTIFTITLGGKLTVLNTFCVADEPSCINAPAAGLVQASDGNFYGTTTAGGTNDEGAIFKTSPSGKVTILHNLCSENCPGWSPIASMTQGTNGELYGTTEVSTVSGFGTVFSWSMNLTPLIEPSPNFGRAGQTIGILGNGLASATGVTFDGVPATFTIESETFIRAMVPDGATTGTVRVTFPNETLASNMPFRVLP